MTDLSQAERTARAKAWNVFVPPVREPAYLGTFEAGWAARADYGRGRERTLEDALKGMIAVTELPGTRSDLSPQTERAKSIARAALVASQPEGLSERSDTEPGEPGGQPKKAHNGIPDDYWREVPCGHPSDPIAVWSDDGYAICHCGWVLNPSEGFEIEGAPGPVVLCGKCGCHVAVPAQPVQPDHGPGEPSYALKRLKSWRDILERETALESRENDEQVEVEGRVLHNLKQAIDAVLVGESNE